MQSIMPPRSDYAEEERRRFERLPLFPLNCTTWAEFAEKMRSPDPGLFAFRVMRKPHHQEYIGSMRGTRYDNVVFGRTSDRSDGRIGGACFGNFLVMEGGTKKWRLKLLNGFGKEDLGLAPENESEWQVQLSNPLYRWSKISEVLNAKEAEEELKMFLLRRVGFRDEDLELTRETALNLKMTGFILRQMYPERGGCPEEVLIQLDRLDEAVRKYVNQLREEVKVKEGAVQALKDEIASLE